MAITPNTLFSSGSVYTADQANRFPRGVMQFNTASTTDTSVTAEEIQITLPAFTAATGRLYRISYYEPGFGSSVAAAMTMRIRLTNLAGTIQQQGIVYNTGAQQQNGFITNIVSFTAGSVVLVGTLQNSAGTGTANRSGTTQGILMVEDIGAS
jgi:hypothetical protein